MSISTKKKKNPAEVLIEVVLNLSINLGRIDILFMFKLPGRSHLFTSSMISFLDILWFPAYIFCICFVIFAPKVFKVFISVCIYMVIGHICKYNRLRVYIVYPVTLLNSFISPKSVFYRSCGIFYVDNSVVSKQGRLYFFLSDMHAFYFLILPCCTSWYCQHCAEREQ